jgi:hypothetical protein
VRSALDDHILKRVGKLIDARPAKLPFERSTERIISPETKSVPKRGAEIQCFGFQRAVGIFDKKDLQEQAAHGTISFNALAARGGRIGRSSQQDRTFSKFDQGL